MNVVRELTRSSGPRIYWKCNLYPLQYSRTYELYLFVLYYTYLCCEFHRVIVTIFWTSTYLMGCCQYFKTKLRWKQRHFHARTSTVGKYRKQGPIHSYIEFFRSQRKCFIFGKSSMKSLDCENDLLAVLVKLIF